MKKIILICVAVLIIVVMFLLLFPANMLGINSERTAFMLNVDPLSTIYGTGEAITVKARLQNETMHAYMVSHSARLLSVSYVKVGEEREEIIAPAIHHSSYIAPGGSFVIEDTVQIDEPGQYTIYVDAQMWINDVLYKYSKSFDVIVK